MIQLEQMAQRLDEAHNENEINEIKAKIDILEWVLNASAGKYHA